MEVVFLLGSNIHKVNHGCAVQMLLLSVSRQQKSRRDGHLWLLLIANSFSLLVKFRLFAIARHFLLLGFSILSCVMFRFCR